MRVAVVGAGVSGLVTARVLRAVGLEVVVFEDRADVGGVWSASRRYPGLGLQSDKSSYSYSDRPMPVDYPKYPSGEQVQAYLADYARAHGIDDVVSLRTKVVAASHDDRGWRVEVDGPQGRRTEHCDWLVLANGVFSRPHVPDLPGRLEFEAAGGVVLHTSGLTDPERCRGRDVVVLGCGKSATDIAVALSRRARSTTMVARSIGWKLPRKVGRLTFEQLIMTRLGEFVIWAPWRRYRLTRLGLRPLAPLRRLLVKRLGRAISEQQDLERRGLLPTHPPRTFNHLETPGFFEAVDSGEISVVQGTDVASVGAADGRPTVRLGDGSTLPADVLVAGTGFDQDLGMLDSDSLTRLLDADGDLRLYRHTWSPHQPTLAFVGWDDSFRSPVGAEVQAMWVAALIHGMVRLPDERRQRERTSVFRLQHARAEARGLPLYDELGQSLSDLDAWLDEAGLSVPRRTRARELVRPLDPSDYAGLLDQLRRRTAATS